MTTRILVHTCCAPCSSSVYEELLACGLDITGYFYNPNIHPETEYNRRKEELINFAGVKKYNIVIEEDSPKVWYDAVTGLENEPERGKRCEVCFKLRIERTAKYAKEHNYDQFTTVMTVSPHKDAEIINKIGNNLAKIYGVKFFEANFKKKNGFKRSLELSKEYGLYRQNYCGCQFSTRDYYPTGCKYSPVK